MTFDHVGSMVEFLFKFVFYSRHGEPWSRFRSKVSKALAAPEAARAAVPALDYVADDFINR